MHAKDIVPIVRRICAELPGFVFKAKLVAATPVSGILRGFFFEDSGFDKSAFYVWAFVQPLYVPATTISFNLGKRLGGGAGKRWHLQRASTADEILAAIRTDGLAFIQSSVTPENLAAWIRSLPSQNDPYVVQARAYSLVAAHHDDEAMKELMRLVSLLDAKVPWMAMMSERAHELARLLAEGSEYAEAKLSDWQKETKSMLRIADLV